MTSIVESRPRGGARRLRNRAVVTGGAGFVGSHIVDALVERDWDVLVIDDLSTGHAANLAPAVDLACHDICTGAASEALAAFRPHAVLHVAAQPSVSVSVERPLHDARVNVLGGMNIATAALTAGAQQFLYVNTGGALYGRPRYLPCDEAHPVEPLSPYGLSKWTLECYLHMAVEPRMPLAVLRLANVYGPRQDPAGEAGVVAVFADRMRAGLPVTIHGDGGQTRDFVYAGDVARAAMLALTARRHLTVNVGSGVATSVRSLFDHLAAVTHYPLAPVHGPERAADIRHSALDSARARRELGWEALTPLPLGLAATLEWMRAAEPAQRVPVTA